MSEPEAFASTRARNLSFAKANSDFNRAWFAELRERAAAGEPVAYVNADVPTEIFKAMDVPVVVNQWWSSVIAAKQKSADYLGRLNADGYGRNLCKYCSMGLAATYEDDLSAAPWGGLPKPSMLLTGNDCNGSAKIFELMAAKYEAPLFVMERMAASRPDAPDWLSRARTDWEAIFGTPAIDALVAQYKDLIAFVEQHTGKRFDIDRLAEVIDLSNQQEEYYFKTRELIAKTRPAPVNIADQMPATMIPQWHRGTVWARDRAKLFYEETLRRVNAGEAAAANERTRLMWLGTGLWYNLDFYEYFQKEFGAVFVWSIYLSIAADAYPTYGDDPLRTLAGRMTKIYNILGVPPFNTDWFAAEARKAGIDGVVSLTGGTEDDCREAFGYHFLVRKALERAGVPVLRLGVDNADARSWDDAAIRARVERFLADEVEPAKAARQS
jgi:benzoyl-CoA reductase/2-hydroxyglutaryl-CoA dehydratase subunit BcrC/BadD/HgdB